MAFSIAMSSHKFLPPIFVFIVENPLCAYSVASSPASPGEQIGIYMQTKTANLLNISCQQSWQG
jgi:hypothetical protein